MKKTLSFIFLAAALFLLLSLSVGAVAAEESTLSVVSLSIKSYPDKTVYGAFERLDISGLEVSARFSDGSEKTLLGSDMRVSYLKDNCMRAGDESVILSYGDKSLYLPVTVNRIRYDIGNLEIEDFTTTYTGKHQSLSKSIPPVVGLDGIPLGIKVSGGGINVGKYDVSIDFSTESKDYIAPENRVVTMEIKPTGAQIIWESLSFVYDGKSKLPTAYYIDVSGAKVYPYVSGAATNAGSSYSATVSLSDPNYEFTNTTAKYEIKKADYDFSSLKWSENSFTYDGSKKSVTLSGLPSGVSVIGYTGDIGQNAGVYTATALLKWDETNYNQPPAPTHKWEIQKADYNMTAVSFKSGNFIYDGKIHYPELVGEMPLGYDGIRLEYSFSTGASHVSEGNVSVVIRFHTDSINYNLPPDRYSSVSISPLGITIDWGALNLSYNGEEQSPNAYSEHCKITVNGKAKNVGKYYATAITQNSDYYIINDKVEYSIIKAHNYWTVQPADSICYEGKGISLTGKSRFGDISVSYYADSECKNPITEPVSKGKYYAVLSVAETENYTSLESRAIGFEILEIRVESFIAVILNNNLKAFQRIDGDDAVFTVINNDGSVELVDIAEVNIFYQNGDSLRRNDKEITFGYGRFTVKIPIEVGYADYDLSEVKWQSLSQIYDGSIKNPSVTGLPNGVTLIGYIGGDNIKAGEYKLAPIFDYDRENYNEPRLDPIAFTIERCPVKAPLLTSIYNGEPQSPISDSPLYTVTRTGSYTDCGAYTVRVTLTDAYNYVFSDTSSVEAFAVFEILPSQITLTLSDVKLRLFEKPSSVSYEITSGILHQGDDLRLSVYADEGRVFVKSANGNYIVNVVSGKIIRLPYPTPLGGLIMLGAALALALIVFLTIYAYRSRQKILSSLSAFRCRFHNRHFKASPPKEESDFIRQTPLLAERTELSPDGEREESPRAKSFEIDAEKADSLITDSLAKGLIRREGEVIYTDGSEKTVINLDTLSKNFAVGERVDVNILKSRDLVPKDTAFIKVLAGGKIDKPLMIYANEFSLTAVKMIALTGGQAIKIFTVKEKPVEEKE